MKIDSLRNARCFIEDIPQWLIDIKDPGDEFNLFEFIDLANLAIEDIFSRGKTPIIVGGTGLYIQGLVEGFALEQNPKAKVLSQYSREDLEKMSSDELIVILKNLDKKSYDIVDRNNPHRLIRAIERAQEGITMKKTAPDYEMLQIGVNWPREILNQRIDERVDTRFDQGMLEEIGGLLNKGVDPDWMARLGLEYGIISKYLLSNLSTKLDNLNIEDVKRSKEFNEMSQLLKTKIHQFAKRQNTWFKRFSEIVWENDYDKISNIVSNYLSK